MIPKRFENKAKNGPRAHRQPRLAKGTTKSSKEDPQTAQASQSHQKHNTSTPKNRQTLQKGATRDPKPPQRHPKQEKHKKKKADGNMFF